MTEEEIIVDEYRHECEFRDSKSFSSILSTLDGAYLGCAYFYPMGVRQPLPPELAEHDVDVSWWVTPAAYEAGHYLKVHAAFGHWVSEDYPFERPHYSNVRMPLDEGS